MDTSFLQAQFLGLDVGLIGQVALIVIMFAMGVTLTPADFRRVVERPQAAAAGLTVQIIVLPIVAFTLVWLIKPAPEIAVGLIILACCPSGATSNFFTHLARGDTALSITLTAISGVIVIFTIPWIVNAGLELFMGAGEELRLPVVQSMVRIFLMIVAPVGAGMALRRTAPQLMVKIEPYVTFTAFGVIVATMIVLFAYVADEFLDLLAMSWTVTVTLNVIMMSIGFTLAKLIRLNEPTARAITIEVGVQNYVLSVVIGVALLKRPDLAIVPIVYLFTMYATVFSFIAWCRFARSGALAAAHREPVPVR